MLLMSFIFSSLVIFIYFFIWLHMDMDFRLKIWFGGYRSPVPGPVPVFSRDTGPADPFLERKKKFSERSWPSDQDLTAQI